ncbi:hypothetical protein E2C01_072231 [Portunus trituberculatus]|uniref:Uncharacterized protein n=1 Tax=Portunus trituberculatus TaxID=210409 RepID=A0A5B7I6L3_PORTR|nr:hypothetical protein [Portunus trituberculatus]
MAACSQVGRGVLPRPGIGCKSKELTMTVTRSNEDALRPFVVTPPDAAVTEGGVLNEAAQSSSVCSGGRNTGRHGPALYTPGVASCRERLCDEAFLDTRN